jgi:hypothetical protein
MLAERTIRDSAELPGQRPSGQILPPDLTSERRVARAGTAC